MMAEVVGGIVGGAHDFNAEFFQNAVRGQAARQRGVSALPDRRRGSFIEQFGDAEVTLQFEVRPVVEGIAQRVGNGSRPGQKFLIGRGIAGNVLFRDAVGPHGSPFIVVPFKPDLEEIGETAILGNIARREMAVVVEDRLRSRKLMIKPTRRVVRQQELFAKKTVHGRALVRSPNSSGNAK